MKARYYWSEDGAMELVDVKKIVADEDLRCYHCDAPISAGSEAMELTDLDGSVYVIHCKCAGRSVDPVGGSLH